MSNKNSLKEALYSDAVIYSFDTPLGDLELAHLLSTLRISSTFVLEPEILCKRGANTFSVNAYSATGNLFEERIFLMLNKYNRTSLLGTVSKSKYILVVLHKGIFDQTIIASHLSSIETIINPSIINQEETIKSKTPLLDQVLEYLD